MSSKTPHKLLTILRHAKAATPSEGQSDAARPLAERGWEDARALAAWWKEQGLAPDYVVASSSQRTRETYQALAETLDLSVQFDEGLYLASHGELWQCVNHLPEDRSSICILGHNPGLHQLCASLLRQEDFAKVPDLMVRYPTCGMLQIRLDGLEHWSDVEPGMGLLVSYWNRHAAIIA